MSGIELPNGSNAAGAWLPEGAHIYSGFVHLLRASGSRSRVRTNFAFCGIKSKLFRSWFGTGANHISRAYFQDTQLPLDVLLKHSFYGYYSLSLSEGDAQQWAAQLSAGVLLHGETKCYPRGDGRRTYLKWCKLCVEEELDTSGFATWKVLHQLAAVKICHLHFKPLYAHCGFCTQPLAKPIQLRLPGEKCPACGRSDFLEEKIDSSHAYLNFLQRCSAAFTTQPLSYRPDSWKTATTKFAASFSSEAEAKFELLNRLRSSWEVNSVDDIYRRLGIHPFLSMSERSITVRLVLEEVLQGTNFQPPPITGQRKKDEPVDVDDGIFRLIEAHGAKLEISPRVTKALATTLTIKQAAQLASCSYRTTFNSWRNICQSIAKESEALRTDLLEKLNRPRYKVTRVGSSQNLGVEYKLRISSVIAKNPNVDRKTLWAEHYRAMYYLTKNENAWLTKTVPGSRPKKKSRHR